MKVQEIKHALDFFLPVIGIGLMVYYDICDTACSSLKGTFLGIDLKTVGILFMVILLVLALTPTHRYRRPVSGLRASLLSGAMGGEILLVRFQLFHQVYCPLCLAFGLCLAVLFALHFPRMQRALSLASVAAGFIAFAFFFEGSVVSLYG